jgi:hypothetical protein
MSAIIISLRSFRSPRTGKPPLLVITETAETQDQPFADGDGSWGTCPAPPPGTGWSIVNFSNEKKTTWGRHRCLMRGPA